jgi:hypothetical protein
MRTGALYFVTFMKGRTIPILFFAKPPNLPTFIKGGNNEKILDSINCNDIHRFFAKRNASLFSNYRILDD